jgi:hypothetical protein
MPGRLAEKLVVPKPDRLVAQQLARSHNKRRIPQYIMKVGGHPPMAQRMKNDFVRV